tara:strand:- start:36 stop:1037 length:1002 start_codon:yes stop_codon:yes gene_type:complete
MSWRDLAQQFKDILSDSNQADQLKSNSSVLTPEQYDKFAGKSLTPARQAIPPADLDVRSQEILDGIDTALTTTKQFLTNYIDLLEAPVFTNMPLSVDDTNSHNQAGSGWLGNRGPLRALDEQTEHLFPNYEINMNAAHQVLQVRHDMVIGSALAETDLIKQVAPQEVRDVLNGLEALNQAADFVRTELTTARAQCFNRDVADVTPHIWAAHLLRYYYTVCHDMAKLCDMIEQIHTVIQDQETGLRETLPFRSRVREILLKASMMEEQWFVNGGSRVHADPRVRALSAGDVNFTDKVNTLRLQHNGQMGAIIGGARHCSNVDLSAAGNAYNPPL